MVKLKDIEKAYEFIQAELITTPLKETRHFSNMIGVPIYLKMENLQHTGSFKVRGATNKILKLTEQEKKQGVVAASAGNHAQGVASIATRLGIASTIFMPETTPFVKIVSTRGFGAHVELQGKSYDEAFLAAQKYCEENKKVFIHAFEDDDVIAGQGTVALEVLNQLESFDRILVPIGGGGLISGISIALKEKNPKIEVIGVQTEAAQAMYQSFHNKKLVTTYETKPSIAEGIVVKQPSPKMYEIISHYVDDVVLVREEEIASAILLLMERSKTVVEGAGAASMAAALQGYAKGKTVVLLSGGNIDVTMISTIIGRGLVKEGRLLRISVKVPDKPGSLHRLTKILAELGANIMQIEHDRLSSTLAMGETDISLAMETKGPDHIEKILNELKNSDYTFRKYQ
ncbi:MAG: threonine ammonia-lyase [Deltaproteobacteria bacterium]|nr:threonine ammonia-lyase [Deltaproteobacteria bacterium]